MTTGELGLKGDKGPRKNQLAEGGGKGLVAER